MILSKRSNNSFKGNVTGIIVKGETLVDISVTAGVVGIGLPPALAAVGVIAALAASYPTTPTATSGVRP
jgi:hypothetical protein